MSIELLLFCIVLILIAVCLLLSVLVVRNHAQIREIRRALSLLQSRSSGASSSAAASSAASSKAAVPAMPVVPLLDEVPEGEEEDAPPVGLRLIRPAALEAEVRALAGEGRVLEAVQRYRRQTGVSLRAAHAAVRDILER